MIIKMLTVLEKRMDEVREYFNKEKNLKKTNQMKNTINELKNTLEGINSRLKIQKNGSVIWKIE